MINIEISILGFDSVKDILTALDEGKVEGKNSVKFIIVQIIMSQVHCRLELLGRFTIALQLILPQRVLEVNFTWT